MEYVNFGLLIFKINKIVVLRITCLKVLNQNLNTNMLITHYFCYIHYHTNPTEKSVHFSEVENCTKTAICQTATIYNAVKL